MKEGFEVVDSIRLLKKDKKIGKVYFQISNIWKYESCTCSIDLLKDRSLFW